MGQPDERIVLPRFRTPRRGAFLLLVLPVLLHAVPGAAANREDQEREARTACLGGDPAKGVMILSELFVGTRDATHIYNQGRCYEQNARYQEAISRFQEYLRVAKDARREDRAEAEKHIADCRAQLAEEAPRVPGTPEPPPPVVPPVSPAVVAAPAPAAGSGLRLAGIVTAAAGGAALVAGIVLNARVNSLASEYESYNGYTDAKESDRQSYETWGWVSYGVGAACVGTGAALYFLGLRAKRNGSAAVTLVPAHDGATLVMRGAL